MRFLLLALPLAAIGCGPTDREYVLDVRNNSDTPYTVLLTKDGPPNEVGWVAPEDLDERLRPAPPKAISFVEIPPGQTGGKKSIGAFDRGTHAVLRVYRGTQTPASMLGISSGSSLRTDLTLSPGKNFVEIDKSGQVSRK